MMAQKHVEWQAWASPQGPDLYIFHLHGTIQKGWHVYAKKDTALGLEPVTVTWGNEQLIVADGLKKGNEGWEDYTDPVFDHKVVKVYRDGINFEWYIRFDGSVPHSLPLSIKGFASNDKEFVTIDEIKEIVLPGGGNGSDENNIKRSSIVLTQPVNNCGNTGSDDHGLLTVFFLGFLGGLLALITPCVFPMIPVTVSFFMGKSESRMMAVKNGLLYGVFIFLIYVFASSPFHLVKGVDKNIFNSIATNVWVNLVFFVVFVLFSLSFFGVFEITLPGSAATKTDARSNLSSVPGIFFMALTLAIVSFSCTGVILGVLLANVASNGPWALTTGMAGFSLALALPFALFAIFPNLLKSLPKSGSWLNTVKKSLAFVELALAFKFLSNADLVAHWGLLKREIFIGAWIIIATLLALYLLGFFEKKKIVAVSGLVNADRLKPVRPKVPRFRAVSGVFMLLVALYLVPGLTNSKYANLKLLSGFPPPLSYSIYGQNKIRGLEPQVVNDYDKALQLARTQHKPLLIDFTGWACVNCRKMEEQVWTQSRVQEIINEKYILVSLYVDDRKVLPGAEQLRYKTNEGEEKQIRTVGDKWAAFQAENFSQVTQPLYVVLSPDEKLLNHPVGYMPDARDYEEWLRCGLNGYKQMANR